MTIRYTFYIYVECNLQFNYKRWSNFATHRVSTRYTKKEKIINQMHIEIKGYYSTSLTHILECRTWIDQVSGIYRLNSQTARQRRSECRSVFCFSLLFCVEELRIIRNQTTTHHKPMWLCCLPHHTKNKPPHILRPHRSIYKTYGLLNCNRRSHTVECAFFACCNGIMIYIIRNM